MCERKIVIPIASRLTVIALLLIIAPSYAAELKDAIQILATRLTMSAPQGRTLRVAVTDFPDLQGVTTNLGRYIPERLTTLLSQKEIFRVVERRRLEQVLKELTFSTTDLVNPQKARKFGKMLGVEAIIVGTISDLGTLIDVDARIIDIETSDIYPGVVVEIIKDISVKGMVEQGREITHRSISRGDSGPREPVSLGTRKYQELPQFRVEVESLRKLKRGGVEVVLSYKNNTSRELIISFPNNGCSNAARLSDDMGNVYRCEQNTGLDRTWFTDAKRTIWERRGLTLPADGVANASIIFRPETQIEEQPRSYSLNSTQYVSIPTSTSKMRRLGVSSVSILNIEPR